MNHTHPLLSLAITLAALIPNVHAGTIPVTSTADDGAAGTLRAAIAAAADGDTVDATGLTGTIVLSGNELTVDKSVTILGPGPTSLTVDANHLSRVFSISPYHTVAIDGIRIINGTSTYGGGIYNGSSDLTVSGCTLSKNSARYGGGIYSLADVQDASLAVIDTTLSGNSAEIKAGGIYSRSGGASATVFVGASTLSANSASSGGGIENYGGGLTVANSTFSGNSATGAASVDDGGGGGGGIQNHQAGKTTVINSTFNDNSSLAGGSAIDGRAGGVVKVGSCILKGNGSNVTVFHTEDGITTFLSMGFNISTDIPQFTPTGTDQFNIDPLLGPLVDNGGPTFTHLPLPGSPAIDKGSSSGLVSFGITTDQRDFLRTVDNPAIANAALGDGTDIGAVELQTVLPPPTPVADLAVTFLGADKLSVKQGEVVTYTISVRNFGPDTAPNVVVTNLMSSGTGFVSARVTKGTFSAPAANQTGTVVWNLGDMTNGSAEGAELIVSVLVKGKTTLTNLVTINSDAEDPDPKNNLSSITIAVATGGTGTSGGGKKK